MRSIRWRLTFAYALALLATMVAFGATLYFARQQTGARTADQRLQQRLALEAGDIDVARNLDENFGA